MTGAIFGNRPQKNRRKFQISLFGGTPNIIIFEKNRGLERTSFCWPKVKKSLCRSSNALPYFIRRGHSKTIVPQQNQQEEVNSLPFKRFGGEQSLQLTDQQLPQYATADAKANAYSRNRCPADAQRERRAVPGRWQRKRHRCSCHTCSTEEEVDPAAARPPTPRQQVPSRSVLFCQVLSTNGRPLEAHEELR